MLEIISDRMSCLILKLLSAKLLGVWSQDQLGLRKYIEYVIHIMRSTCRVFHPTEEAAFAIGIITQSLWRNHTCSRILYTQNLIQPNPNRSLNITQTLTSTLA